MEQSRSMPRDLVVPVLGYPDVADAVAWLTRAFGFTVRWRADEHRAQLGVGGTAAVEVRVGSAPDSQDHVLVRVEDVDAHQAHARASGAVCTEPEDHPDGERQYAATDPWLRTWLFSQTIADVAPADWGATEG